MKRKLNREETRNRLVAVGLSLFIRKGYHGTGIKDIVNEAMLPKGSFYTYFSSKESFGGAVVEEFTRQRLEKLDAALSSEKTPLEGLLAFFTDNRNRLIASQFQGGCLLGNFSNELDAEADAITPHLTGGFDAISRRIAVALERAQADGVVRSDLPAIALADLILNGWEGSLMRAKTQRSTEPLDRFIRAFFETLLKP